MIDGLLEKVPNFELSSQTETGSAEEQPAMVNFTSGINEVDDKSSTTTKQNFLNNA